MATGIVKWFSGQKGFGFIQPDDGSGAAYQRGRAGRPACFARRPEDRLRNRGGSSHRQGLRRSAQGNLKHSSAPASPNCSTTFVRATHSPSCVWIGWDARSASCSMSSRPSKQGVALLSLEEKIDTSSAAGELVFHVFSAIAQFELRLIAEHTRDGMNAARAKGSKPGRPAFDQEKLNAALMLVKAACSQQRPRAK
jgi:hypothetical protein